MGGGVAVVCGFFQEVESKPSIDACAYEPNTQKTKAERWRVCSKNFLNFFLKKQADNEKEKERNWEIKTKLTILTENLARGYVKCPSISVNVQNVQNVLDLQVCKKIIKIGMDLKYTKVRVVLTSMGWRLAGRGRDIWAPDYLWESVYL